MTITKGKRFKANLLLVLAAAVWGFAFVAQRVSIQYVGPFTFNGIRFALGSVSLIPLILLNGKFSSKNNKEEKLESDNDNAQQKRAKLFNTIKAGILIGSVLFIGASLQQIGLKDTTAGKAAFITGFYIILVPLFGVFLGQRINKSSWLASILAISGLYLISVTGDFKISRGDLFQLLSSFFWAAHILLIAKYARKAEPLILSLVQYIVCSLWSLSFALMLEDIALDYLVQALLPILYGGIGSVGIAYTLQMYGQRYAKPSHAAVILSLEAVFATIGEFLILGESMDLRGYTGCALMFAGVLISQVEGSQKQQTESIHVEI